MPFTVISATSQPTLASKPNLFSLACISNQAGQIFEFEYRWGDGPWRKLTSIPGKNRFLMKYYDLPGDETSPPLYIRYDEDLTQKESLRESTLESRPARSFKCKKQGTKYSFRQKGLTLYVSDLNTKEESDKSELILDAQLSEYALMSPLMMEYGAESVALADYCLSNLEKNHPQIESFKWMKEQSDDYKDELNDLASAKLISKSLSKPLKKYYKSKLEQTQEILENNPPGNIEDSCLKWLSVFQESSTAYIQVSELWDQMSDPIVKAKFAKSLINIASAATQAFSLINNFSQRAPSGRTNLRGSSFGGSSLGHQYINEAWHPGFGSHYYDFTPVNCDGQGASC